MVYEVSRYGLEIRNFVFAIGFDFSVSANARTFKLDIEHKRLLREVRYDYDRLDRADRLAQEVEKRKMNAVEERRERELEKMRKKHPNVMAPDPCSCLRILT